MSTKAAAATPTEKKTRTRRTPEEKLAATMAQIEAMKKQHDDWVKEAEIELATAEGGLKSANANREKFLASLRGMA